MARGRRDRVANLLSVTAIAIAVFTSGCAAVSFAPSSVTADKPVDGALAQTAVIHVTSVEKPIVYIDLRLIAAGVKGAKQRLS
jgi:hypothetical protein